MTPTPTITSEQRDALYDQILDRLSGIGDLWLLIEAGKLDDAERLAREFGDDLRVLNESLGWGDSGGSDVELTTPPSVLRRALSRHCQIALSREGYEEPQRTELRMEKERNEEIVQACRRVLAQLDRSDAETVT